ncbi:MAG: quinoprotein relay system zinc metallohydrolase 2 [Hyphomicrobium sp.]
MHKTSPPKWRHLHRRAALLGIAAAAATFRELTFRAPPASAGDAASPKEIASGVFVHCGRHALADKENGGDIANLTFIVGAESVAVIDTGGSALIGQMLRTSVAAATKLPVRYVINTHMHPDHVLGNAAFEGSDVAFVAHHKMARALAVRAERYLVRAREQLGDAGVEGTKIVYPTRGVETATRLDLGGRALILTPRPTAHTDNDMTVFDDATGTLLAGDLLFSEHIPTLDGSIRGWLSLIEILRKEKAQRVVPGHGPASMSWPDALKPMQQYLEVVANDVRAAIKDGKTLSEATESAGLSERGAWRLFDDHHIRNVTAAFAELEWE